MELGFHTPCGLPHQITIPNKKAEPAHNRLRGAYSKRIKGVINKEIIEGTKLNYTMAKNLMKMM